MRIRTRLLILILSILVPAFVAALLAVGYVYLEERRAQENSVRETVRTFAQLVGNELEIKESILLALANSPALERNDLATFYQHARALMPTRESNIVLFDLDGHQLLNTRLPFDAELPFRRASNVEALAQRYGAERTLVSDLFLVPHVGQYDFVIQVPVRQAGRLRYFLTMGVDAASLQRLVQRQRFPSDWQAIVIDRAGRIAARTQDAEHFRGRLVSEVARRRFAAGAEGVFSNRNLQGTPVQGFFSTVPEVGWKVMVTIPKTELRRVPLQAAAFLAAIMLLLLVVAIAAASRFGKRALAPIHDLGRGAEDLGQGREVAYTPHGVVELDAVALRMAEASRRIRHAQQELEQRVQEAVGASEQAQAALVRSQKMEALGRLTGGIAHEFNNLLQTLTTALQLAALTATQPKVLSLIDTCKRTVARATALTGQLGSFGRVQDARLLTIDPCAQAHSAAQLVRNVLRQGVTLELDCADGLWPVTVDPLQFDLALLNLSINARDAMPDGGLLRIAVRNRVLEATRERAGGDYVQITVADTGSGMPPEVLARALDPFFTTKAAGQGSGLGLPQAYAFASQSQGFLHMASTVGEGTAIEICLPRSHQPLSHPPARPGAADDALSGGGRVLFVEDDPLVREAVVRALEEAGFEVLVAASGDEALARLDKGLEVDVMFSDIVMPGKLSGVDLAGLLRERRPGLPVVLATGYTDQRVAIPGVQVLSKPYEIGRLVDLLANLAQRA
ncbi:response regulator [Massilia sp. 9096]|uniref:hybrid sensor histidine kinase/response regulator n=1 Tax=Massilia sp. 9096 TaxID=1500894 RepID=UPI00068BD0E1|nr:response regulator [Massilia sp. 9096]